MVKNALAAGTLPRTPLLSLQRSSRPPICSWTKGRGGEGTVKRRVWYGILEFNVPLDTVYIVYILETTTLSSDEHLPFSNGGPAT